MLDCDTDTEIYFPPREPSPDIQEEFQEGLLWEYVISSEEVGYNNEIRHETKWKDWTSNIDQTNNSWREDWIPKESARAYDSKQARRRAELANASADITLWANTDIIDDRTRLRAQAYDEKLERHHLDQKLNHQLKALDLTSAVPSSSSSQPRLRSSTSASPITELSSRLSLRSRIPNGVASSSVSPSKPTSSSFMGDQNLKRKRGKSSSGRGNSRKLGPSHAPRNAEIVEISSDSSEDELLQRPKPPPQTQERQRLALSQKWSDITKETDAASITIVNDVDDEAIPPLPRDFLYIENRYMYAKSIQRPSDVSNEAWMHCICMNCTSPDTCDCQPEGEQWEIEDHRHRAAFAYNSRGFFSFLADSDKCVVECNKYCRCDASCPNRIAQLPRQIPIEVFKTDRPNCGWGARSSVTVERGTVLGIYTGRLITRQVADNLTNHSYTFDLDWLEHVGVNAGNGANHPKYSVDSLNCGNWTRFINHSCNPNLQVYSVVYDSIPDMNTPYIAFAAKRRIPAREEFTFDYQPSIPKDAPMPIVPRGASQCECGSDNCCGWVCFN
ncbi:SET domain-containing protein [Hymenopellis radicata]|nr:SET domain-containing protein [Hymenopellis radicata]